MLIRLHVRVLNARREDELGIPLEGKLGVMKNALAEATKSIRNAMEINGITVQPKLNSPKISN